MKTIHTEIGIDAPAPIVWDVISDLKSWEKWNPIIKVSGPLAVGETLTIDVAMGGDKAKRLKPKIVRLVEGKELRWRGGMLLGFVFQGEHGFRVSAEDKGRSRFEQFEVFSGLLSGVIVARDGKRIETGFQAINRLLKREAEARARA
ncbi:MAG: SRPBCC domain-containing protein [Hyphomicrobiales bacterium]|nr:SRPBCC domain-containing protein [Hyphomicrobiales bacterium]